jgi:hypothetical protein
MTQSKKDPIRISIRKRNPAFLKEQFKKADGPECTLILLARLFEYIIGSAKLEIPVRIRDMGPD